MRARFGISARRKLASSSGLSILIALAFVLICALVSVVVISSASVNAERLKSYRAEQQSYLAKVSALNLVQDIIVGDNDDNTDGIRMKKVASGSTSLYSPEGSPDNLGIVSWMCNRANGVSSPSKFTMQVDASSLDSLSVAQVKPVTLEISFNGQDVRARAYDYLDGSADSAGAVTNITREFSPQIDGDVMSWRVKESS